jgi:hypothetical protein
MARAAAEAGVPLDVIALDVAEVNSISAGWCSFVPTGIGWRADQPPADARASSSSCAARGPAIEPGIGNQSPATRANDNLVSDLTTDDCCSCQEKAMNQDIRAPYYGSWAA